MSFNVKVQPQAAPLNHYFRSKKPTKWNQGHISSFHAGLFRHTACFSTLIFSKYTSWLPCHNPANSMACVLAEGLQNTGQWTPWKAHTYRHPRTNYELLTARALIYIIGTGNTAAAGISFALQYIPSLESNPVTYILNLKFTRLQTPACWQARQKAEQGLSTRIGPSSGSHTPSLEANYR